MERRDRELKTIARDREPAKIRAQQQRAAANARRQAADARRRPGQHRGRAVEPDDDVAGPQQRQQETPGPAAEIEDRSAALVRERAVEADVVAPPPVLPVVQHGIFERIPRRHCRGNVRA